MAGAVLVLFVLLLNHSRLALMSVSPDEYYLFHDGDGRMFFEIALILVTFGATFWGLRNAR